MICRSFLPFCDLSFQSVKSVLEVEKFLILLCPVYIYYFFHGARVLLVFVCEKCLPIPSFQRLPPNFPFRISIVIGFTFGSILSPLLYMVCDMKLIFPACGLLFKLGRMACGRKGKEIQSRYTMPETVEMKEENYLFSKGRIFQGREEKEQ